MRKPTSDEFCDYFSSLSKIQLSQQLEIAINKANPCLPLIQFLIDAGATIEGFIVDGIDSFRSMPLHEAARIGNLEIVKLLVENGADITACFPFMGMPIHLAAKSGHTEVVRFFVENGVDVDIRECPNSFTPLHCAAKNNHIEVMMYLIEAGANLEAQTNYSTPIYWAVIGNAYEAVYFLINQGVRLDLSIGSGSRRKGLIEAALNESIDLSMHHQVTRVSIDISRLLMEKGVKALVPS